jgi:AraC family transcriptional regulator
LALAATTRQPEAGDPLVAEQLGTALAICVARLLTGRPAGPDPEPRLAISPQRLRRVLDYIDATLGERDLSLARIAAIAHLSPFHFSRAFKAATGTAPHRFVVERRVERAKALLAKRELSLAEIAYDAGFANQAHFSTMFRRITDMTPGEYRQSL